MALRSTDTFSITKAKINVLIRSLTPYDELFSNSFHVPTPTLFLSS